MECESVLVVDDENIIRSILSEVVGTFGYDRQTAADGYEALQLLKEKNFEIVLSDIHMPGMNGFDLIRETREVKPDIPFILVLISLKNILKSILAPGFPPLNLYNIDIYVL